MSEASPRVINTHDQLVAAGGGVAITKHYSVGRSRGLYGWSVYRIGRNAPWYEHGCKTFGKFSHGSSMAAALAAAQEWVAETFAEPGPWKRNRCGDYVPERIAKAYPLAARTGPK